jgi:predicted AlkP superfamily phosphohydrolase/phosphomutase
MKVLVIGLDCAAPELLLGEDLPVIRHLMSNGVFGCLESVIPPITVPAWMCMATSQDPGSLGVYGFRNRVDRSYDGFRTADATWFSATTLWDQVAMQGGKSILVGVPPSYPPKRMNGIQVGCFLTPDSSTHTFTYPEDVGRRINELVGHYPVDVKDFRTEQKDRLLSDILAMTRTHFEVVRHLLVTEEWDYFQFVEIGLDRMHHAFWKHHDPRHRQHDPESPYREVVRRYYRLLDHEIGTLLGLVDEDTMVLVASDHGAQALDGGFCVNEWLIREGLLTLKARPHEVRPLEEVEVDWDRTKAWSTGGYYARIFLNVEGREDAGVVPLGKVEALKEELVGRLEATLDDQGKPLGTQVFRPEAIYTRTEGFPPDLIVHFGDLAWRAVGGIGYETIHVQENDTGPDDCNHAQFGAFILAGPGIPARGNMEGAHLLDMAPTLLARSGYDVPSSMQGKDFLALADGRDREAEDPELPPVLQARPEACVEGVDDPIVRERLKGLGYLS